MKSFIITCVTAILTVLVMTCLLELNKTDEVIETIENQQVEEAPVYNNYETHNHYEQKEVIIEREIIVEKEANEEPSESEATDKSYVEEQIENSDGYNVNNPNDVLRCEVCEKSGTELKVWYDDNGIKHYTCTERCTEGLGVLYGE